MKYLVDVGEQMACGDFELVDELLDALYAIRFLDDLDRSRTAGELCDDYLELWGTTPSGLLIDDQPGCETVMMITDRRSEERRVADARRISLERAVSLFC